MVRIYVTLTILILTIANVAAQHIDTMTGVFNDNFKSLTIRLDGNQFAPPIIFLGSDDHLIINFDELAEERSYLRYKVLHCNANWQPSMLVESEYVDGFNMAEIEEWDYSRIALTHYINYNIVVPNEDMNFLVSGNYLLQVYNEDDPDTILLQVRFMVSEQTADVSADVLSVTDIDYNDAHQQVSVMVDATNAHVEDPFNDLMLYVSQNGRLDNEVMVRQPLRTMEKRAYYEHLRPLIFKASNEYRRIETVSNIYPGMGVETIEYFEPFYHATLQADYPRSESKYEYDQTQHGRFFIREYNSERSDIEADYIATHFTLVMPELEGQMVFLDGDFVNRRFDTNSVMTYNRATGAYEKTLLLKQGAYNYQYLTVGAGQRNGQTELIEGDYHETGNEYVVRVYHRPRGERYDRLIGATVVQFK